VLLSRHQKRCSNSNIYCHIIECCWANTWCFENNTSYYSTSSVVERIVGSCLVAEKIYSVIILNHRHQEYTEHAVYRASEYNVNNTRLTCHYQQWIGFKFHHDGQPLVPYSLDTKGGRCHLLHNKRWNLLAPFLCLTNPALFRLYHLQPKSICLLPISSITFTVSESLDIETLVYPRTLWNLAHCRYPRLRNRAKFTRNLCVRRDF
jgi:hypothetical protein